MDFGETRRAPACRWTRKAKAASISLSVLAFRIWSCTTFARAVSCTAAIMCSVFANAQAKEHGDHLGLGNQLGKQLKPLGMQLSSEKADAREVAARPGQAGDQTLPDRVMPAMKTIGIVDVAFFAASAAGSASATIISTLRPTRWPRRAFDQSNPSAQQYSIVRFCPSI